MPSKTFLRSRDLAFVRQGGRYFYCDSPMWATDEAGFATKYRITLPQSRQFQCTGEHLKERQQGGDNSAANVVAACRYCNQNRHRCRPMNAPDPTAYKQRVQKRMANGSWLGAKVLRPSVNRSHSHREYQ